MGEPFRSVRTRRPERRNQAESVAPNVSVYKMCKHDVRLGGKHAPTLPSPGEWRAGRRWPRSRGTAESARTPGCRERQMGPGGRRASVSATTDSLALTKRASKDLKKAP